MHKRHFVFVGFVLIFIMTFYLFVLFKHNVVNFRFFRQEPITNKLDINTRDLLFYSYSKDIYFVVCAEDIAKGKVKLNDVFYDVMFKITEGNLLSAYYDEKDELLFIAEYSIQSRDNLELKIISSNVEKWKEGDLCSFKSTQFYSMDLPQYGLLKGEEYKIPLLYSVDEPESIVSLPKEIWGNYSTESKGLCSLHNNKTFSDVNKIQSINIGTNSIQYNDIVIDISNIYRYKSTDYFIMYELGIMMFVTDEFRYTNTISDSDNEVFTYFLYDSEDKLEALLIHYNDASLYYLDKNGYLYKLKPEI